MKVKEFIARLSSYNMDAEVVFEEGKQPRYQPLDQNNGAGSEKRLKIKLVVSEEKEESTG